MSETVERHTIRYPNCRASTVAYLVKREETTQRLRQELGMQKQDRKPWWKRVITAFSGQETSK
ncbi:hypothetical protein CHR56_15585 [Rhizobium leguminosarum bv. viciae]|nr:hypothetical protein CHR56_15585 [Rhizobium leguminosarum bv. viciae]